MSKGAKNKRDGKLLLPLPKGRGSGVRGMKRLRNTIEKCII